MIYYESIKPMVLYLAHEIRNIEVICRKPSFSESSWLKIHTVTGKIFYIEKNQLDDMQKYPKLFPQEEKKLFASAQTKGGKKEAVPV